jgi:hypothetical protein
MNDFFDELEQRIRDGLASHPLLAKISETAAHVRSQLAGLHRNESGATLTEFIIMLPIFILVFNGVMILGQFTRKGIETPIRAYQDTFEKVLPFQTDFGQWTHMQTAAAAASAGSQLAGDAKVHNLSGAVEATANVSEGAAYTGLGLRGHMGESYARTNSVAALPGTTLKGCDGIGPAFPSDCIDLNDSNGLGAMSTSNGKLTSDLSDLTGGSDYADQLFNDGTNVPDFSGGGSGILSMVNSVISAAGIRPVLAANIRYGTVYGEFKEPYSFAGLSMDMQAQFSTLVPPTPKGATMDAAVATAITRTTMESHDHYTDLLGIANDQPLSSESFSVPSYP